MEAARPQVQFALSLTVTAPPAALSRPSIRPSSRRSQLLSLLPLAALVLQRTRAAQSSLLAQNMLLVLPAALQRWMACSWSCGGLPCPAAAAWAQARALRVVTAMLLAQLHPAAAGLRSACSEAAATAAPSHALALGLASPACRTSGLLCLPVGLRPQAMPLLQLLLTVLALGSWVLPLGLPPPALLLGPHPLTALR